MENWEIKGYENWPRKFGISLTYTWYGKISIAIPWQSYKNISKKWSTLWSLKRTPQEKVSDTCLTKVDRFHLKSMHVGRHNMILVEPQRVFETLDRKILFGKMYRIRKFNHLIAWIISIQWQFMCHLNH